MVCACTHHSSLWYLFFCVWLRCPSMPIWMNFRTCGCLLAPQGGITLTAREFSSQHYIALSSSHNMVRALPCAEIGLNKGFTWCSDSSPQVQTGPTRTVTSELMPATLAEAATQLSFAAFLERCISVRAPAPPPLPISTPPLDTATETIPHIAVSQDVSTQLSLKEFSLRCVHPHNPSGALAPPSTHDVLCPTCSRPVPSLLLDAVQTPLYSVASHDASTQKNYRSRSSSSGVSLSVHCNAGSASPPQPADIAALCSPSSASHASDGHEDTAAPRVVPQPPPGLEKCARQCASHGTPAEAARVRPRLSVTPPTATCQYHPSGNTSCAVSSYLQEKCKYRPCWNTQSCWCRSSSKNCSFS